MELFFIYLPLRTSVIITEGLSPGHRSVSNAQVNVKCCVFLIGSYEICSGVFFFGGGEIKKLNDTFGEHGKLFASCRKRFGNRTWKPANCFHADDGVGGARSHKPCANTCRQKKVHKKKKTTCDFPRHLDYSCKESVDRKPRVCSQQEIQ